MRRLDFLASKRVAETSGTLCLRTFCIDISFEVVGDTVMGLEEVYIERGNGFVERPEFWLLCHCCG